LVFRGNYCSVTLCDVTLDWNNDEVKPKNSINLSAHLIDVEVLNSTAVKLKLSPKNSRNVTIEISQNNHVWKQQNLDKGKTFRHC